MDDSQLISSEAEKVVKAVLEGLTRAGGAQRTEPLFFPHGIELIRIDLDIGKAGAGILSAKDVIAGKEGVPGAPHPGSDSGVTAALTKVAAEAAVAMVVSGPVELACAAVWDQYKSDCSGFAKAVAQRVGIDLSGDADAIVDTIRAGTPWNPLKDGVEAARTAEDKALVIGGLKSSELTPPRAHGHVVIVVPGPLASGLYPTAWWGTLGGIGEKSKTVNFAFRQEDRDRVHYAYRPLA